MVLRPFLGVRVQCQGQSDAREMDSDGKVCRGIAVIVTPNPTPDTCQIPLGTFLKGVSRIGYHDPHSANLKARISRYLTRLFPGKFAARLSNIRAQQHIPGAEPVNAVLFIPESTSRTLDSIAAVASLKASVLRHSWAS